MGNTDDIDNIPQFEANDETYTAFSAAVMNLFVEAINRNSNTNSTGDEFIRVNKTEDEIKISFNKDALLREIQKALNNPLFNNNRNNNQQSCLCRYA